MSPGYPPVAEYEVGKAINGTLSHADGSIKCNICDLAAYFPSWSNRQPLLLSNLGGEVVENKECGTLGDAIEN